MRRITSILILLVAFSADAAELTLEARLRRATLASPKIAPWNERSASSDSPHWRLWPFGGPLVSTFLTLIHVPLIYDLFAMVATAVSRTFRTREAMPLLETT